MRNRIIHSYPARLAFLVGAVAIALLIVQYRILIKRDVQLVRANSRQLS